ncbi:hypothetical protein BAE46_14125 [Glaciecola punicea]|uniref:AAA family ATPase n=1 Tax=Glaciecola punicea TaxID=56804 RepID=UPI000871FCDA|nr:AAA family ATPase [Glaciecola punicea]OFA29255.1 hypothetical protein BAE46_14125 [Glaciecola punicea]
MLRSLVSQAIAEKSELALIKSWAELNFDSKDKEQLCKIDYFSEVMDSSIRIDIKATSTNKEDNVCIIPSQYILYAIKIKSFADNLYQYIEHLEVMRQSGDKSALQSIIDNQSTDIKVFDGLDDYSKALVLKPFTNKTERVDGKELINNRDGKIIVRPSIDFFGSIILKVLNIPDDSSVVIGKVIFHLCANPNVFTYLQSKFNDKLPFVKQSNKVRSIAEGVFRYFMEYDGLQSLIAPASLKLETYKADSTPFNSSSLFKLSPSVLSSDELTTGDTLRYFVEPLTYLNETNTYVYLTTQWMNKEKDDRSLNFINIKRIFENAYPAFKLDNDGGQYKLFSSGAVKSADSKTKNAGGRNIIYYGAPGTGKSHSIKESAIEEYTVRTVFHADTLNSDFVGCLKPKMAGDSIRYEFRPGPFTNAITNALNEPSEHHWLVIEEINRAPAAAVFGEIFHLLDREIDGESTHFINLADQDMIKHIEDVTNRSLPDGKLKLPSNLSLLATMNSSDQAVLPLDTAFKRRWNYKYIPLDFDRSYTETGKPCAEGMLVVYEQRTIEDNIEEKLITWRDFAMAINAILTVNSVPEDKHLGPFFLSDTELTPENRSEALTGKLFMYLWDDVLRHGMSDLVFNSDIHTYGQLTRQHQSKEPIFSDSFYDLIIDKLKPIIADADE